MNSILSINKSSFDTKKVTVDQLDVQLHGAFLIFSENYINTFNGLYNKTFLYMEEDILRLRCEYYNLLMIVELFIINYLII